MTDKLLIMPYYGKFPNYFHLWLERIKLNKNLDLLLITDNNLDGYDIESENIKVLFKELSEVKYMIENVVEKPVKLNAGYKVKDYFPLYGQVFSEYIAKGDYKWWGSIDADVILGNTEHFLNSSATDHIDRILGNGHFSLYRNNQLMNNLWKDPRQKKYYDLIPFEYTRKLNKNTAFDEYGWRWGKGISTFMEKIDIKINNNFRRADLDFNYSRFSSKHIKGNENIKISRITVNNSRMMAIDEQGIETEIMYTHLQKRRMKISELLTLNTQNSVFDILPNIFVSSGKTLSYQEIDLMSSDFQKLRNKRIKTTKLHNLFSDYVILRLLMFLRKAKKRVFL